MMNIIRKLFLPEKVGSYYLFSQRTLAFQVEQNVLYATLIRAHRNKRTIEKFYTETYDSDAPEELTNAIQTIYAQVKKIDKVHVSLPSSLAVFKSLRVPFTQPQKAKLILPLEIEPLLPFSTSESVLDGLVYPDTQDSYIMAVAIKKTFLTPYLEAFNQANISIDKISVTICELFSLYLQTQNNTETEDDTTYAFINIGREETSLLLATANKIHTIRTIRQPINNLLQDTLFDASQAKLPAQLQSLINDIQFTLSTALRAHELEKIDKIILTSAERNIESLEGYIKESLDTAVTTFNVQKITHLKNVQTKTTVPATHVTSLATALPDGLTTSFNLGNFLLEEEEQRIFNLRIFIAISLLVLTFCTIFIFGYFSLRSIQEEERLSKFQVKNKLQKEFNLRKIPGITALINSAQQQLITEESIWSSLSTNRFAFLRYIQTLTSRINKEKLGLELKRLALKNDELSGKNTLVLEGSVKDYDSLRSFEETLQESNMFESVPELQELKFNIALTIHEREEEK